LSGKCVRPVRCQSLRLRMLVQTPLQSVQGPCSLGYRVRLQEELWEVTTRLLVLCSTYIPVIGLTEGVALGIVKGRFVSAAPSAASASSISSSLSLSWWSSSGCRRSRVRRWVRRTVRVGCSVPKPAACSSTLTSLLLTTTYSTRSCSPRRHVAGISSRKSIVNGRVDPSQSCGR
jgi:hypothetical protein